MDDFFRRCREIVVRHDGIVDHFLGDTVNIASRLQGEAAAGEVLVTEQLYEQIADAYPDADKRVLELKGIGEPVPAYSLEAAP